MQGKTLSDAEYLLVIEEEKRLCENNVQFLKGTMKKGVTIENGEIAKIDKEMPSIRLGRKLIQKDLYRETITRSMWKMAKDRDKGELNAFLEIDFPETNASTLRFCFNMSTKLKKIGEGKKIKIGEVELIETFMEFEGDTGTILQWMKLLISSGGNISISDGEEPSIGTDGVPIDIPRLVLGYFDKIIKEGGKVSGDRHVIIVKEKDLKYE